MGAARGRGGAAKAVGVQPRAVEAWSRAWGHCQGPWRRGQDRGGTARGRGGVAKAEEARTGAVGAWTRPWGCAVKAQPRPCGCSQGVAIGCAGVDKAMGARPRPLGVAKDRGGTAMAMGALPGAVGAQSRPWGGCQGPWGRIKDRGGAARGRWGAGKAVGA